MQPEVKATPEDIAHSLEGNWREELVFVPGRQMELYKVCQEKIAACDVRLRKHLESFGSKVDPEAQPIGPKPKGRKGSKNAPQFDLRSELYRITGIGWAQVNGIDVLTAQTVIAEAGDLRGRIPPWMETTLSARPRSARRARRSRSSEACASPSEPVGWHHFSAIVTEFDCAVAPVCKSVALITTVTAVPGVTPAGI